MGDLPSPASFFEQWLRRQPPVGVMEGSFPVFSPHGAAELPARPVRSAEPSPNQQPRQHHQQQHHQHHHSAAASAAAAAAANIRYTFPSPAPRESPRESPAWADSEQRGAEARTTRPARPDPARPDPAKIHQELLLISQALGERSARLGEREALVERREAAVQAAAADLERSRREAERQLRAELEAELKRRMQLYEEARGEVQRREQAQHERDSKRQRAALDEVRATAARLRAELEMAEEAKARQQRQLDQLKGRLRNLQRLHKAESGAGSERRDRDRAALQPTNGRQPTSVVAPSSPKKATSKPGQGENSKKLQAAMLEVMAAALDWALLTSAAAPPAGAAAAALTTEQLTRALPALATLFPMLQRQPTHLQRSLLHFALHCLLELRREAGALALRTSSRRIGEEVHSEAGSGSGSGSGSVHGSDSGGGGGRANALLAHSDHEVRLLAALVGILTVPQADLAVHAFDVIRKSVGSEEGMEMMLRLRGLEAVRAHVPSAAPALLACALDVVMTVALDESALGPRFLQQLCCVSWLQSLTEVLLARPPGAARQLDAGFSDVSTQEKVSVILQRISTLREAHAVFLQSGVVPKLQVQFQRASASHAFLALTIQKTLANVSS